MHPLRHLLLALVAISLALPGLPPPPARAQVVINEYLAANATGITDEDGDREDWIELYNGGTSHFDLTGCGLTDDQGEPGKWIFPVVELAPDQHLLLFASDKDRSLWLPHWETVVTQGDTCRYHVGHSEPPSDWATLEFDDKW